MYSHTSFFLDKKGPKANLVESTTFGKIETIISLLPSLKRAFQGSAFRRPTDSLPSEQSKTRLRLGQSFVLRRKTIVGTPPAKHRP